MNEIRPENDVNTMSIPQVILLTLLATTVTSVATAIVVVQLMSGVPGETVFQTIERVTETVVERPTGPVSDISRTVIIKEGDLVAKAVADNKNSSQAIFFGDETTEVVLLGYGFVVGGDTLISRPLEDPDRLTTAGLHAISTHGRDKIMLWRIINDAEAKFTGSKIVDFVNSNPQVGQTMVYLGGDGSIVRGSITGVSATGMDFSEKLSARDMGLMLDIGGEVIGVWTGNEILLSASVLTQIEQLAANPLLEIPTGTFNPSLPPDTNPDDLIMSEKRESCRLLGGTLNEYGECLGVDQSACLVLGGEWNECGSACRHNAEAKFCTLQCELYCQL